MTSDTTRACAAAAVLLLAAAPAAAQVEEPAPAAERVEEPAEGGELEVLELGAALRGEGTPMSAERAARLAVRSAPSIERARAVVREAHAAAERARDGLLPRVAVSARYTRLSETPPGRVVQGDLNPIVDQVTDPASQGLWRGLVNTPFPLVLDQWELLGALSFPLSEALLEVLPALEAASGLEAAQAERLRAERALVALRAREAFYEHARARGALAVTLLALRQAELRAERVRALETVGRAGRAEALRVRAHVAAAEVAVARAEAGVELSHAALRTLVHLPDGARIAVAEEVLGTLPGPPGPRAALIAAARERRPEARALRRVIAARTRAVEAAEGARYPSLAVAAGIEYANPTARIFPQVDEFRFNWQVTAQLEWSLHDVLDGERRADEERARRAQARAELDALEDAIALEVTRAAIAYESARVTLEAARVGLEAAEEALRARMAQLRVGTALLSDAVDAAADRARAQLDLVDAAIDARVALARLRHASGLEAAGGER